MGDVSTGQGRAMLIVDDDHTLRSRLMRAFEDRGFDVAGAGSYEEAIAAARHATPELALVDLRLPTRSGLDVVRGLKELDARTIVVVLTGYGSIATAVECVKAGACTYRTKPVDAEQILAAFDGSATSAPDDRHPAPSLARVEWEHIQRVLTDCGGNVSRAARMLRIHRRSLQRKLNKDPDSESQ